MPKGIEIELRIDDKGTPVIKRLGDTTDRSFKRMGKTVDRTSRQMTSRFDKLGAVIKRAFLPIMIAAAGGGILLGLKKITSSFIGAAGQLESYATQLEAIEGSAANAQKTLQELMSFAAKTPFEIPELIQTQILLKSVGITGKETLRIIGDTAGAMGKDIQNTALALVSMETEVLRRLGIQLKRESDKATFIWRTAQGEMKKITVANTDEILRATLLSIWNERYKGGMEKLAKTWRGILSMMSDAAFQFTSKAGATLLGGFKRLVSDGLIPLIKKAGEWVERNKELIEQRVDQAIDLISDALGRFGEEVKVGLGFFSCRAGLPYPFPIEGLSFSGAVKGFIQLSINVKVVK